MKNLQTLSLILLTFTVLFSCKNNDAPETPIAVKPIDTVAAEKPNVLAGKIFRDINEIPELKDYEHQAGALIDKNKKSNGDYAYAIGLFGNEKNYLVVLEELIKETNNPKSKYKILDTLNITKLEMDETIAYCSCRLNKISDPEIIAVVKSQSSDDEEFYSHIIKAWRADTQTHKIIPIPDIKGIDCSNENYGL